MFLKLWHCQIIWYLFAAFKTIILCSVHSLWFVKYVFSAKIWFMKVSPRIVKYESLVTKSNPERLKKNDQLFKLCFWSSIHFFHFNVPENECHKQKWCVLFFTCINKVASVLARAHAIACIKWRRLTIIFF